MKKKLEEILEVLDTVLGDSEPYLDDDMTDEEIREEEPIFWAHKEINELINKL